MFQISANLFHDRNWRSPRLQRRRPERKMKKKKMRRRKTRRRKRLPALNQMTVKRKWTYSYQACNTRAKRVKAGKTQVTETHFHTVSLRHTHFLQHINTESLHQMAKNRKTDFMIHKPPYRKITNRSKII